MESKGEVGFGDEVGFGGEVVLEVRWGLEARQMPKVKGAQRSQCDKNPKRSPTRPIISVPKRQNPVRLIFGKNE